jgi:hypothetical protein
MNSHLNSKNFIRNTLTKIGNNSQFSLSTVVTYYVTKQMLTFIKKYDIICMYSRREHKRANKKKLKKIKKTLKKLLTNSKKYDIIKSQIKGSDQRRKEMVL